DAVEVIYARPVEESTIRDSLKIVEGDQLVESWPRVSILENILRISPDTLWQANLQYELRIWDPIIGDYRKLQPTIWNESELGGLNVVTEDSTLKDIRLQISNEESEIMRDTVFTGEIVIGSLPLLNYTVTAFQDRNGNGEWDYGQVSPFVEPEPYFIQPDVPVKEGMTGDLTISFSQ
ncbi:MAG TPA: hypothetical protein VK074_07715, partial [Fodinibius sp.]|nr:hypothetical protein [Fodinibius sp.]